MYLYFKLEAENLLKIDVGRLKHEGEEKGECIGETKVAHLDISGRFRRKVSIRV